MIRTVVICNAVLTVILAITVVFLTSTHPRERRNADVLRAKRVELVDNSGRVRASLGMTDRSDQTPALSLFDQNGREAVFLSVNERGYATMFFQSRQTEGKVALGYLTGSDVVIPAGEDDPLGAWGIRVRGKNLDTLSYGFMDRGTSLSDFAPGVSRRTSSKSRR